MWLREAGHIKGIHSVHMHKYAITDPLKTLFAPAIARVAQLVLTERRARLLPKLRDDLLQYRLDNINEKAQASGSSTTDGITELVDEVNRLVDSNAASAYIIPTEQIPRPLENSTLNRHNVYTFWIVAHYKKFAHLLPENRQKFFSSLSDALINTTKFHRDDSSIDKDTFESFVF